jgi:hydroxypyruvate isomerase
MAWALRYASHLGYRTSDAPLFRESVGSLDLLAHVAFAAELGFAGIQYALARSRPVAEQEAVVDVLARYGLETGCVIYTTRDKLAAPLWARTDGETRAVLNRELAAGFEAAKRVNSRYVAVLSGADPRLPIGERRDAMAEKLRWAAPLAERAGITLLLEFISTRSVANLLLHHIEDAHAMVKAVDSPAVRLIFDLVMSKPWMAICWHISIPAGMWSSWCKSPIIRDDLGQVRARSTSRPYVVSSTAGVIAAWSSSNTTGPS